MQVLKCDRCGTCYEEYDIGNNEKEPNCLIPASIDNLRKYYLYSTIDLCPSCMKEFRRWMKNATDKK